MARDRGDYDNAAALFTEALTRSRKLDNTSRVAAVLCDLGVVARNRGDYVRAATLLEEGGSG